MRFAEFEIVVPVANSSLLLFFFYVFRSGYVQTPVQFISLMPWLLLSHENGLWLVRVRLCQLVCETLIRKSKHNSPLNL